MQCEPNEHCSTYTTNAEAASVAQGYLYYASTLMCLCIHHIRAV